MALLTSPSGRGPGRRGVAGADEPRAGPAGVGLRPPVPAAPRRLPGHDHRRRPCWRWPRRCSSGRSSTRPSPPRTTASSPPWPSWRCCWPSPPPPSPGRALLVGRHRRGPHLRPAGRAVRPRAAHADRLLHPHPDRRAHQPAEQRRHRRPAGGHRHARLGGRPTSSSLVTTLIAMVAARVAAHAARRSCSCPSSSSRPSGWAGGSRPSPARAWTSTPSMNTTMTERFNVSGALLVKLFGRHDDEVAEFSDRAGRVRDIGVRSAMYGRTFFIALGLVGAVGTAAVYWVGGQLVISGTIDARHARRPRPPTSPASTQPLTELTNARVDLMTAFVSFERVFEVLDTPNADRRPTRAPSTSSTPTGRIELDDVWFRYPAAAEVSLASLEGDGDGAGPLDDGAGDVGARSGVTVDDRARASWSPWSARRARASPPSPRSSPASTTSPPARCASTATTCATSPRTACAPPSAWSARTRTCSTTRSPTTCATPGPTPPTTSCRGLPGGPDPRRHRRPARRLRHRRRRAGLPAVGRREAAARHRPHAAEGPGRSSSSTRPPATSTPRTRRSSSRRSPTRSPGRTVARHRPPPVDHHRRRPDPRPRRGPLVERGTPRRAARRAAASTPTSTAPWSARPAEWARALSGVVQLDCRPAAMASRRRGPVDGHGRRRRRRGARRSRRRRREAGGAESWPAARRGTRRGDDVDAAATGLVPGRGRGARRRAQPRQPWPRPRPWVPESLTRQRRRLGAPPRGRRRRRGRGRARLARPPPVEAREVR